MHTFVDWDTRFPKIKKIIHTLMVVCEICLEETLMVVAKTSFNMCKFDMLVLEQNWIYTISVKFWW